MNRFMIGFLVGTASFATNPRPANQDVLNWLTTLGGVNVTDGGTLLLPQNVLSSQFQGKIPPILQFAMQNHLMNRCTEKAISLAPNRRTPFIPSFGAFDAGLCILSKCFQQEMLMMVLPQLSAGLGNASGKDVVTSMLSAFTQSDSCNDSQDKGIDPLLITLLTKNR